VTEHRYAARSIMADYGRAGAGTALTLGPLLFIPLATIAGTILFVLSVLFIAFGLRTWGRQRLMVQLDDSGVTMSGLLRKNIAWRDITALQLRYYAVKRDRSQGWMQLTIRSADSKMQMESALDDFEQLVAMAAQAAKQNDIALTPSTIENIKALGLPTDELQERRDAPVERT
jgi:hypothetical protein